VLDVLSTFLAATDPAAAGEHAAHALTLPEAQSSGLRYLLLIPFLPLLGAVLCTIYRALGLRSKISAWTTVALLAVSFLLALKGYADVVSDGGRAIVHGFEWINMSWGAGQGKSLIANFSFYLDPISGLWMLFVTGLATLIALYASEYMADEAKTGRINRFFGAFCLFVFSMACLVMGDNLLLLFLGWEGVGLCSYLLIGYFHEKPSAVAAAKKAFILNRIGDVGLSLGVMFAFVSFGSLEFDVIFQRVAELQEAAAHGAATPWHVQAIPLLLMIGAFGKSAQLPLYVWLPDAMEGPTPVSALIHAATMVTAGVYLIARTLPIFALNPDALVWVAWIGGLTAFFSATIGMATFDIKRIMAYSTVSQLGYMFLGLGVLVNRRGVPRLHARVLQSDALPVLRRRDARVRGTARPPQALGALEGSRLEGRERGDARRVPVSRWLPADVGLLLEGPDHRGSVRHRGPGVPVPWAARAADGGHDRLLQLPRVLPRVPWAGRVPPRRRPPRG